MKESLKSGFVKQAADKLKQVEKFLGSNQWFAGARVRLLISQNLLPLIIVSNIGSVVRKALLFH